ncbi:hypothetical protein BJ741DRAFT_588948, partial [Chytriomyces cf. hyalinus JEL632]
MSEYASVDSSSSSFFFFFFVCLFFSSLNIYNLLPNNDCNDHNAVHREQQRAPTPDCSASRGQDCSARCCCRTSCRGAWNYSQPYQRRDGPGRCRPRCRGPCCYRLCGHIQGIHEPAECNPKTNKSPPHGPSTKKDRGRPTQEIQTMLRPVFRHLARTGILSTANASPISADLSVALERSSLPFRGSTEAFETDLLISVQALNVVCSKIRDGVEMEYGVLLD